jgi:hypothetical protein
MMEVEKRVYFGTWTAWLDCAFYSSPEIWYGLGRLSLGSWDYLGWIGIFELECWAVMGWR